MRIGVWNVEYADVTATNARRLAVMECEQADIWILTESHDSLSPGSEYCAAHSRPRLPHAARVKDGSRWASIWSRFPMESKTLDTHDADRVVAVHIDAPIGPLTVYGTVFPWRGDTERKIDVAVAAQGKDWTSLRQRFPTRSLIVAGDLNSDLISTSHFLTKQAHTTIDAALIENDLFVATHPNRIPPAKLKEPPIDHVLLPNKWKERSTIVAAWEGKVGKPRLSDHSGLIVEVSDL